MYIYVLLFVLYAAVSAGIICEAMNAKNERFIASIGWLILPIMLVMLIISALYTFGLWAGKPLGLVVEKLWEGDQS